MLIYLILVAFNVYLNCLFLCLHCLKATSFFNSFSFMLIICGFVILSLKPPFDLIYNFYLNKEFFKEVLADFFFFFNKLNVSL